MFRIISFCFALLLLCTTTTTIFSQTIAKGYKLKVNLSAEDKESLKEAEAAYQQGNYADALEIYSHLMENNPEENYFKFKKGMCYLNKTDEKEKAISLFEEVNRIAPETKEIQFYLGQAYHLNNRFDEAIKTMENFTNVELASDKVSYAKKVIKYSINGKELIKDKLQVEIKNVGEPVNTQYAEYVPVISADESVLIFTYKGEKSKGGLQNAIGEYDPHGEYCEDVFITRKVGDKWLPPESIDDKINTSGHDASIALSIDGKKLFIYKSTAKDGGDIYMSQFNDNVWSEPVRLEETINTKYWEGSITLSADEKIVYFSSERPGGFGGRDIYRSVKQENGKWGPSENLGKTINTSDNEDAPFILTDGKTLFFSSDGVKSMGGYDIFITKLENNNWSEPENVGYPINTADNEIYYTLSGDMKRGYYSTAASGGKGLQDIYVVSPAFTGKLPPVVLVKGIVTSNNKPVESKIIVHYSSGKDEYGVFYSDKSTGKYLISMPAGYNYTLTYEKDNLTPLVENLNTVDIIAPTEKVLDVEFKKSVLAMTEKAVTENEKIESKKQEIKELKTETKTEFEKNPEGNIPVKKSVVNVKRVFFEYDKSTVNENYRYYLDQLAKDLKANPQMKIEITGHTDSKGSDDYNMNLARKRAMAVHQFLMSKGISTNRLNLKYKGESAPSAPNENPDGSDNVGGRSQNRRVELKLNNLPENIEVNYEENIPEGIPLSFIF